MKKFLVLLAALTLVTGFAFSQDIGLTPALEFSMDNITQANGGDMTPTLMPYISYSNSFLDSALDLYSELDYTMTFPKDTDITHSVYFDLELGYNLKLAEASTLSFLFQNEENLYIAPQVDGQNSYDVTLTPGLKFNQDLSFGGLYLTAVAPLYVVQQDESDFATDLNVTAGWDSTFGFSAYVKEYLGMTPDFQHQKIRAVVDYTDGPCHGQIKADFIGADNVTVTLIPKFEYSFIGFTAYIYCTFANIGGTGDATIAPAVGVTYSF
ncbi:MAG: hypothetical protein FWF22_04725 [Treponema sp.]|nr:hypothetical protein [Treponema sp.]